MDYTYQYGILIDYTVLISHRLYTYITMEYYKLYDTNLFLRFANNRFGVRMF